MIINPVSGQIKEENGSRIAMVVLEPLHVEWYPVHWDQIPENQPETCPKINLAH